MADKAKCRICGKEFSPCKGIAGIPQENQPFNWRKICCSPPCGSKFIADVLESRGLTNDGAPVEAAAPAPAARPRRQRKLAPKPEVPQEEPETVEAEEPEESKE